MLKFTSAPTSDWCSLFLEGCMHAKSLQLCHPIDCNPLGSSVQGILHVRMLEWFAMPSSRGSSWPRDWTCVSLYLLYWQASSLSLAPLRKPHFRLLIIKFNCQIYGVPWWLSGKGFTCNARNAGSIPESGKSPGEKNDHHIAVHSIPGFIENQWTYTSRKFSKL